MHILLAKLSAYAHTYSAHRTLRHQKVQAACNSNCVTLQVHELFTDVLAANPIVKF